MGFTASAGSRDLVQEECGVSPLMIGINRYHLDQPFGARWSFGMRHETQMNGFLIRIAEPTDLTELYELVRAKAEFDGAVDALTATEAELGAAIFCEAPQCDFAVAVQDGVLIGFAAYYPVFSTYAARPGLWMDDLFVEAKERSRGVGRGLLQFLAEEAMRRGCCKLEWSLQTSNLRGIAFYEREGAVVREENRFAKLDEAALVRLIGAGPS